MTVYLYDDPGTLYGTAVYDSAADGAVLVELYLNGVWTNVTAYVRVEQGITITRGRADEQSAPSPATCALTFDNRDGRFTPTYAAGAYYPYVARNTQIRVSVFQTAVAYVRFWGEVSEWPVRFDHTGREVTVDVVAGGIRRRLQRAAVPHASAYKSAEIAITPMVGYWPMEDADGAQSFGSALAGGTAMSFTGTGTLADNTTMIASDPLPTFVGDGAASAPVDAYTPSGTGQQVRWLQCDTVDSGTLKTFNAIVDTSGAYFFQYVYQPSTDTEALYMIAYTDPTVVVATNGPFTHGLALQTTGCRMSIELKQNGANIEMNVVELPISGISPGSFGIVSTAGTLGRVTGVRFYANFSTITYTLGHLSVENHITSIYDLGGPGLGPLVAWAGETASARATRIAASTGVAVNVAAGTVDTLMGAQLTDTSLAVFDDAAYVDGGLSTETVSSFALQWRGRSAMYDLTPQPSLTLLRMLEIEATTDDQTTENDVTVSRTGGGSSRAVATTGLTPAAVGTYAAGYDLNLYTDLQTIDHANWRMSMGSLDKPRWPVVAFDAVSGLTSGLRDDVLAMREGLSFGITAISAEYLGINSPVATHILGWTETITDSQWLFSVNLGPGDIWNNVFVLDSATLGILDTNRLGL